LDVGSRRAVRLLVLRVDDTQGFVSIFAIQNEVDPELQVTLFVDGHRVLPFQSQAGWKMGFQPLRNEPLKETRHVQ
jgi:hypothetical protein